MKYKTVRIHPETHATLRRLAYEWDMPVVHIIRRMVMIVDKLPQKQKEVFKR